MPHQCTECGHVFEDGSKEMLSGCPECGGNKFQFLPEGATESSSPASDRSAQEGRAAGGRASEDSAQADARSTVVDSDELPESQRESASESENENENENEETETETADLERLREELNDQFESIRIVDHGQYELDLMELYKREEFIIALQENGRYVIEVPESFRRDPGN